MFKCFMFKGMISEMLAFKHPRLSYLECHSCCRCTQKCSNIDHWAFGTVFSSCRVTRKLTIESKHFVPSTQIGYRHHGKMHRLGPLHNWWVLSHSSTYILQPAFCIMMRGHCVPGRPPRLLTDESICAVGHSSALWLPWRKYCSFV